MQKKRPVNLDLTTVRFPLTAISSIFHRVTGVLLFLGLPFLLYLLASSLHSDSSFVAVQALLAHGWSKFILWLVLTAAGYHVLAGIRHILMDFGFAESFQAGSRTAMVMMLLAALVAVLLGVWLW